MPRVMQFTDRALYTFIIDDDEMSDEDATAKFQEWLWFRIFDDPRIYVPKQVGGDDVVFGRLRASSAEALNASKSDRAYAEKHL